MKHLLLILCLFVFSCDSDSPTAPIHGCFDSLACNYNPSASIDNNSCTYAEENEDCNGQCLDELIRDDCGVCDGNNEDKDFCNICFGDDFIDDGYCQIDINVLEDLFNFLPDCGIEEDILTAGGGHVWNEHGRLTQLYFPPSWESSYGSGCLFTNIPNSIENLEFLEEIIMLNQMIYEIPDNFSNLNNLENANFRNNEISIIYPSICTLIESPIGLNISENKLCDEYYFNCIQEGQWGTQDQSNCCEGPEGQPNWTTCP